MSARLIPSDPDRRIRVVYVIDKLQRAGAQIHLLHLVRGLDPEQFAPRVYGLMQGGPVAEALCGLGIEVTILGLPTLYGPAAWRALPPFVRDLRTRGADVVHTYLIGANLYGTLVARLAGARAVVTSRRDDGFSRNWRLRLLEEWLVNPKVDRVVAVSPSAARAALRERGLDASRVLTLPNGVSLAEFDPAAVSRLESRRRLGLAPEEAAVGILAHLSPVKGHADLLEAMPRVTVRCPRARLLVVGDGELRGPLEEKARALGIASHVVFTGARSDVAEVLAALDLVVLSSHTEGLSNALLEAMAMARPVVATAVGGNLDVLEDGVTALLVPPREPEALAAAIARLLTSPEEAARLGRAARRKVEDDFGLDLMVARHETLYRDLLHA
jgi:glycosyltransferase involved in cell wall biosynthesis